MNRRGAGGNRSSVQLSEVSVTAAGHSEIMPLTPCKRGPWIMLQMRKPLRVSKYPGLHQQQGDLWGLFHSDPRHHTLLFCSVDFYHTLCGRAWWHAWDCLIHYSLRTWDSAWWVFIDIWEDVDSHNVSENRLGMLVIREVDRVILSHLIKKWQKKDRYPIVPQHPTERETLPTPTEASCLQERRPHQVRFYENSSHLLPKLFRG